MSYTLIIVALPFLMFLFLGLVGGKMKPVVAGLIGTIGLIISTVLSYIAAGSYFFSVGKIGETYQTIVPMNFEWLRFTDKLHIDLGIMLDPISVMMLVVITTVSLMVHIYSFGYMKGERGFQRYYALLSLFSFSMLGLVIAPNIFQMYIFWELVGVSSYSLIGFYYTKPSAVAASKKAFIVTRFADLFFLIGILVLSFYSGTFSFQDLTSPAGCAFAQSITDTFMGWSVVSWAMMLIFIGGAGKSAMLPFHIWLPDAMEGPTPVSALIHAATMVVAGVFLVARMFPVYIFGAPDVLTIITYIGATTALFAAVVACTQTDIKRVLAFSTISQIAYMITALGVSGYGAHEGLGYMASMFHLFTHAFFKALLFLGAGAVIHAVHSNEMDSMGGLRKYLPITHITFLIACLSISGIPPFSGFFSKDEILVAAFEKNQLVFWCLYFCAGLTAFYMFRLYYRIFWGDNNKVYQHTPHEAPVSMTIPLIFLAALTCVVGFIPFSEFISTDKTVFHTHIEWSIASLSILVAVIGIAIATWMYRKKNTSSDKVTASIKGLYTAAYHKFYFDEIWIFVTKKIIFNGISKPVAWFDRHVVDGFMNLQSTMTNYLSRKIKFAQSGEIQDYAWAFMMGAVVIISLLVFI
ncbi:MAG: NADH-quinone oxidoreductase subunit L [Bacteroidales bacterium]|nr:NADH-quinone oxidoreductase subunit L [Bacteroidales bacterium]